MRSPAKSKYTLGSRPPKWLTGAQHSRICTKFSFPSREVSKIWNQRTRSTCWYQCSKQIHRSTIHVTKDSPTYRYWNTCYRELATYWSTFKRQLATYWNIGYRGLAYLLKYMLQTTRLFIEIHVTNNFLRLIVHVTEDLPSYQNTCHRRLTYSFKYILLATYQSTRHRGLAYSFKYMSQITCLLIQIHVTWNVLKKKSQRTYYSFKYMSRTTCPPVAWKR